MKMEKRKILTIILLGIVLLASVLQIKSLATNSNIMVIKKSNDLYLIYVNQVMDKNFSFAFSNSKEATGLNYITAITDSEGNYVAYVDEDTKKLFDSEDTYMWLKTNDEEVIKGEKITLNGAKTIEELNKIKNITKNITIQSTAEEEKIKINGSQDETYYYQFGVGNLSEEYNRLVTLINEISKYDENINMFTKLQIHNELYNLYNSLVSNLQDENWIKAENLEITKPYEAKEDQQYVLWLKDSKGNIDVQFLTAYEKTISVVKEKANIEQVATALPVTYDEITNLFIALGIVIIAIIAVIVFKMVNKKNKRED